MARLLIMAAVALFAWRLLLGRWPWQKRVSARDRARDQAVGRARQLLALPPAATRSDIVAAHRRLVATVHPDRGGSSAQIHEADAARDLLLEQLSRDSKESA